VTTSGRTRLVLVAGAAAGLALALFTVWSMPRRAELTTTPLEVEFEPDEPYIGALPDDERARMLDQVQEAEEERYGVAEAARRRALREQLLEQRTSTEPTRP
jgi:hypothetical protein